MTRPARIALIASGLIVTLAVAAVITGLYLVQSDWLRNKLRQRIIAEAEKAIGGRVEIGAFNLNWRTLTADVDNLVIHGTEPVTEPPLLAIQHVRVGFKIISLIERDFNVASITA